MTEITVEIDNREAQRVSWLAFVGALVLAPLAVAAVTFWIYLIPVFAVFLGAPTYLLVGGPFLAYALRYNLYPPFAAFLANLCSFPMVYGYFWFVEQNPGSAAEITTLIIGFGMIFAPIWGWMFGVLYRAFAPEENHV